MRTTLSIFLSILLLLCYAPACRKFLNLRHNSGTILNVEVKTDEPNAEQITERAVGVLQNRLRLLGADGEVSKTAPNRIELKIYDGSNVQRLKEILLAESRFELRKIVSPPSPAPLQVFPTREAAMESIGGAAANRKVLRFADSETLNSRQWVIVENPSIVDGSELRDASATSRSGKGGDYQISFSLKPSGAQKFGDWTGRNIGNYVAVVLNDEVKSAAFIKSQIFDSGEIDGKFTEQQADDLVLVMKSGYLPAVLQLIDEKTFGR